VNLSILITTHRQPICPICLEPLHSYNMTFVLNVAICASCAYAHDEPLLVNISHVLTFGVLSHHCAISNGLIFFTPRDKPSCPLHILMYSAKVSQAERERFLVQPARRSP